MTAYFLTRRPDEEKGLSVTVDAEAGDGLLGFRFEKEVRKPPDRFLVYVGVLRGADQDDVVGVHQQRVAFAQNLQVQALPLGQERPALRV